MFGFLSCMPDKQRWLASDYRAERHLKFPAKSLCAVNTVPEALKDTSPCTVAPHLSDWAKLVAR